MAAAREAAARVEAEREAVERAVAVEAVCLVAVVVTPVMAVEPSGVLDLRKVEVVVELQVDMEAAATMVVAMVGGAMAVAMAAVAMAAVRAVVAMEVDTPPQRLARPRVLSPVGLSRRDCFRGPPLMSMQWSCLPPQPPSSRCMRSPHPQ